MHMTNYRSVSELLTNANYLKLVEAINLLKETKPLAIVPKVIVYNPTYCT